MRSAAATVVFLISTAIPLAAQDCPPCPAPAPSPTPTPEPAWKASAGGGLTATGGNSETTSFNVVVNVKHDPKTKNVFRFEMLHLQSSEEGEDTVDRTQATLRDEYTVNGRLFVFGDLSAQRDHFQQLDYLVAPMVGAGFNVVDTAKIIVSVDTGLGVAFEQLEAQASTADFAVRGGERLEWKPSEKMRMFQKATAIWKANEFGDAYYRFEVGLATSLARRFELKLSFADDYKTRPAANDLDQHDTSFIVSLLFKL